MSRQVKIVIFSIILIASYFIKQENNIDNSPSYSEIFDDEVNNDDFTTEKLELEEMQDRINEIGKKNRVSMEEMEESMRELESIANSFDFIEPITINDESQVKNFPIPENGFSPYDFYVGKGVYDNSSGNEFEIKNSNSTHAIVLLVDAYSGKKIRNEFIRKGTDFLMTGVPDGTYYLQWFSGDDWSPKLKIGGFIGGFQSKQGFTKTRDMSDWMKVDGYAKWTVTLYAVEGGDVESESIDPDEFLN